MGYSGHENGCHAEDFQPMLNTRDSARVLASPRMDEMTATVHSLVQLEVVLVTVHGSYQVLVVGYISTCFNLVT